MKHSFKIISKNKKAFYDYFLENPIQAGIELVGTEVKSLRAGKCNLKESYISINQGEAFIEGLHISPYEFGNIFNKDPLRKRKLLLHKKEINKLYFSVMKEGFTIVATQIYFVKSFVKIDIALAKGKKNYDKREVIAKKDQKRQIEKEFKIKLYK